MSTLVRSMLQNSLAATDPAAPPRKSVQELEDKIGQAYRDIDYLASQWPPPRAGHLVELRASLVGLEDERDALVRAIEETEEAADLMWDLRCAISDATDCDGITDDTLRAALEHHGLIVSRAPTPAKYIGRPGQKCSDAKPYITRG